MMGRRDHGVPGRGIAWPFCCIIVTAFGIGAAGCSGRQSGLDPAGRGAEQIADLFWWMVAGSTVIWLGVVWLTYSAIRGRVSKNSERQARYYVIGGGALVPTVVLAALLIYGLRMMPELIAPAPPGTLKIRVVGEQWWWRVRYEPAEGEPVELANEIHLPVGRAVEFELESPDVIHSFWIPSLGGKMDLIPGRRTRLLLHPTRTGTFRGACAEYCGTSHALMAFDVVVSDEAEFASWLSQQRRPADEPVSPLARDGREYFFLNGCAACHSILGTDAWGVVGPNLTHVGGRLSIGAGVMPNGSDGFRRWLGQTNKVKPEVHMPHFGMLPPKELDALSAYLESLQ
jgi:cytochrome c oxidase subunit II